MTDQGLDWSESYATTRVALQLVAVHILARRRSMVTGRFGLRPTPGGFATPMFGHEEVLRIDGVVLVRERRVGADGADRTASATIALPGVKLRTLAEFADVDLAAPFSVGHETPEHDGDAVLEVEAKDAGVMADWYALGAQALDRALVRLGAGGDPAVAQLWPEHFDLAVDVAVGATRVNLGASPGDGFSAAPYLYVGPWTDARPGDATYWNAPFGAVATFDEIVDTEAADAFFAVGLAQLTGA